MRGRRPLVAPPLRLPRARAPSRRRRRRSPPRPPRIRSRGRASWAFHPTGSPGAWEAAGARPGDARRVGELRAGPMAATAHGVTRLFRKTFEQTDPQPSVAGRVDDQLVDVRADQVEPAPAIVPRVGKRGPRERLVEALRRPAVVAEELDRDDAALDRRREMHRPRLRRGAVLGRLVARLAERG